MSSEGADVQGIELTESYANYAKEQGFTVHTKPIETLDIKKEFDLVVTFHTLEHVFDPKNVILSINKSLKDKGVFMGEVPNQDDWRLTIFENEVVKRFHYDPNHYYYFSPETLKNYLNKAGFGEINLEIVERYNSFIQIKRILTGQYNIKKIDKVLNRDIFVKSVEDVRIHDFNNYQESEFNKIFQIGVNENLMGNCLRWTSKKEI